MADISWHYFVPRSYGHRTAGTQIRRNIDVSLYFFLYFLLSLIVMNVGLFGHGSFNRGHFSYGCFSHGHNSISDFII